MICCNTYEAYQLTLSFCCPSRRALLLSKISSFQSELLNVEIICGVSPVSGIRQVRSLFKNRTMCDFRVSIFFGCSETARNEVSMNNGSPTVKWLILVLLVAYLTSLDFITYHSKAQSVSRRRVSPDSIEPVHGASSAEKVSPDLIELVHGASSNARVTVIIQFNDNPGDAFESFLLSNSGHTKAAFLNFKAHAIELPSRAVQALAARPEVGFVSLDRTNISFGHISLTTGADAVRVANGTNVAGLDGSGIGIAILDSGIDPNHTAFLDRSNNRRVIFSRDFTGEGRTYDPYGHGTHVASIAAGNGRISNAQYTGIAPNANLINLRVLGATGLGTVSAVLAALDWVMSNHVTYNIRVVNMSLGAPAVDSYRDDPVCRAVRALVDAGVVVVAAVGNNGGGRTGGISFSSYPRLPTHDGEIALDVHGPAARRL